MEISELIRKFNISLHGENQLKVWNKPNQKEMEELKAKKAEIIVELKTAKGIDERHQAQLMNYLKACKRRFGLIINFGKSRVEIKRMVNGYNQPQMTTDEHR